MISLLKGAHLTYSENLIVKRFFCAKLLVLNGLISNKFTYMKVTKKTFIGEVMADCPECANIFLEYGLQCAMCGASSWETIEEGCTTHGMEEKEIKQLVKELNKAIEKYQTFTHEEEKKINKVIKNLKDKSYNEKKICLPVQVKSTKEVLEMFDTYKHKCDIFEIWLDHIEDLDIKKIIEEAPQPIICVCKGEEEKGKFKDSEKKRVDVLIKAAKMGAEYIDIGIHTDKKLIKNLIREKCESKIIISHHNWNKTPKMTGMLTRINEMLELKPAIIKYVSTAESLEDNTQIIRLANNLKKKNIKFIVMAMGEKGKLSRVFTPFLGSQWMYAPAETSKSSALGQITAEDLKTIWNILDK